jgi:UDP-N-acetylglucosamine--dolichyl-phosphate N-acetylglucosaminephosphotransferase
MTESNIIVFVILVMLNAVLTRILLQNFNYFLMGKGIFGIDINKSDKPKIPEEGGLSITISFFLSLILYSYYFNFQKITPLLVTTPIICLLGFIDHFRNIKPYPKFIYTAVIGSVYTIYYIRENQNSLMTDLILVVVIGVSYAILVNAYNLLAGFNGLESGITIISGTALSIFFFYNGHHAEAGICVLMLSGYSVFWILNKYPAKIFIGDSGTLVPPSVFFGMGLITGHILPVIFVMSPHILNIIIKYISIGVKSRSDLKPLVLKDGLLHFPEQKYYSLIRLFLLNGPKHEKHIVYFVYLIEFVFCVSLFLIF